ncbi:hypothetical protein [Bordetella bronchialis]|uniref:hypothetical protein n=1 Tax=Bordetella bronchialis TaxID=463025 RepID=UPI0012EAD97A|nr:hypothetical protein [Bordetella bronchialis]
MYGKLVFGVGIYEPGPHSAKVGGRLTRPYVAWKNMLYRCCSHTGQARNLAYRDVVVAPEFLRFQAFADWYVPNEVAGWDIDKDVLCPGSKTYSSSTCCFLPPELNRLFKVSPRKNPDLPTGVVINQGKHIQAQIGLAGRLKYLGLFSTIEDARKAYLTAKKAEIRRLVSLHRGQLTDRVIEAIDRFPIETI